MGLAGTSAAPGHVVLCAAVSTGQGTGSCGVNNHCNASRPLVAWLLGRGTNQQQGGQSPAAQCLDDPQHSTGPPRAAEMLCHAYLEAALQPCSLYGLRSSHAPVLHTAPQPSPVLPVWCSIDSNGTCVSLCWSPTYVACHMCSSTHVTPVTQSPAAAHPALVYQQQQEPDPPPPALLLLLLLLWVSCSAWWRNSTG